MSTHNTHKSHTKEELGVGPEFGKYNCHEYELKDHSRLGNMNMEVVFGLAT